MSSPKSSLYGKLAFITGASGTIGLAITKALVEQGCDVILTARNIERLDNAAMSIRKVFPHSNIHVISCDITIEVSVVRLFELLDNKYHDRSIDIVVNNAGVNVPGATLELSADDFNSVLHANVTGPFLVSREAMKRMKDNGGKGGRIINIGSLSAHSPRPDSAPYTASKFALNGLSHSLAVDGRSHNIAVGIIHPGNVLSDLLTDEMKQNRQDEGFIRPEQVADCVVTMSSLPHSTNVLEMTILPTTQPYMGRG